MVLTVCVVVFSVLCGCQEGRRVLPPTSSSEDDTFPEFLVGTWRPNESRWVFTFEPDGSISTIKHFVGMEFEVAAGGLVEQWSNNIEAV